MKSLSKIKIYILGLVLISFLVYMATSLSSNRNQGFSSSQEGWPKWLDSGSEDYVYNLATDGNSNVYLRGWSEGQLFDDKKPPKTANFLVKYSESGKELWHKWFNSQFATFTVGESDDIYTVTTDPNSDPTNKAQYLITKYDKDGKELWRKKLGSFEFDYAPPPFVVVSSSENLYVFEESFLYSAPGEAGSHDSRLTKYDDNGKLLWRKQLDFARVNDLKVDSEDNLYLGGYSFVLSSKCANCSTKESFVSKFDKDGNEIWHKWLDSAEPNNGIDIETDIAGNLYLLIDPNQKYADSYYPSVNDDIIGLIIIKYDADGNKIWERNIDAHSFIYDVGLTIDLSANIYVSGSTEMGIFDEPPKGEDDAFIVKYDKDGNEIWHHVLASGNRIVCSWTPFGKCGNETAGGLATDSNGYVYLAGSSDGPLFGKNSKSKPNIFIVKYK